MDKISKVWTSPLPLDSPYIQPKRLYYIQDGIEKNWDLMKVHDSVSIILYNKSSKKLVFVKQFRPPVYYGIINKYGDINNVDLKNFPANLGITIELCAGIVDKQKSLEEIAKDEVLEECGYNVESENLESVINFRCDVGLSGAQQSMFFCEVTDKDKIEKGGGVDDELIEVVEYTINEAEALLKQGSVINSPPSFLFGVLWFLNNKCCNLVYKFDEDIS